MKWAHSLRLRVTLWCALLLTLCCTALAVTSNPPLSRSDGPRT